MHDVRIRGNCGVKAEVGMQAFLTALVFIMVVGPSATRAAEIVLEQTAVQKLVQKDLFNDKGRLMLVRGTCEAYL